MAVYVTGMVTGQETSHGKLDNGDPWSKHCLVLLEGTRTVEVRLDKGWEGPIPEAGQRVVVECTVKYGKFLGVRHTPQHEKQLLGAA